MELGSAIGAVGAHVSEGHSVSRAADLSAQERIFVDAFVGNGGKGADAVLAAGYSATAPDVQAARLLCRSRVAAAIKARCETFAHSMLPVAVKALLDICETAPLPKDRIKAANSLIELAGLAPIKGGTTVNVGVQVNGGQAQSILRNVEEARARRLSGIAGGMSDNLERISHDIDATLAAAPGPAAAPHPGGEGFQGPAAVPVPLPPPSSAPSPNPDVSDWFGPEPAA